MAKARTFTIRILGDSKDAQRALKGIGSSAKGLSGSFKPATAGLGKLFAATVSFAAIGGIVRNLGALAYAASDLGEVQSKVNQIFGESASQLDAWTQGSAKAFGQSKTEALNAASTFGVFGKSAGLTGTELTNFSTDLTELAADMASFNNTTIDEAVLALGSGLRGENEPLRRFGVLLDDATLRMEALKLGLIDNTKQALTPQQKVLAATSAIYSQTSDQQGDFARTADGAANQTRILTAQFKDMKTKIGNSLLPVLNSLLGFATDLIDAFDQGGLGGALEKIGTSIKEGAPVAFNFLKEFLVKMGNFIVDVGLPWLGEKTPLLARAVWEWIKEVAPPALRALGDFIVKIGNWLVDVGLPWLGEKSEQLAKALWEWIQEAAPPAIRALGDFIGKAANWLLDEGLPKLVEKTQQMGQALVDWIEPRIGPALKELGKLIGKIAKWAITDAIPKLIAIAGELAWTLTKWAFQLAPDILKGLGQTFIEIIKQLPGIAVDLLAKMGNLGVDIAKAIFNGIVDGIKNTPEFALDLGKALVNGVIDFINIQLIDRLNDLLEINIDPPGPGSIKFNPPDISHIKPLAKGGIVTRPTLALIGEAGPEAVIPLSHRMSGASSGDTYVTIHVTKADPDAVVAALRQYMRTNGAVPIRTAGAI